MKIVCLPADLSHERDFRGIADRDGITTDGRLATMTRTGRNARARAAAGDIFPE